MRYAAKWLGLVAAAAVMVPFAEIPGFFKETGVLMPAAMAQSNEERKAEADQLRQQGIQLFNVSQFREAIQFWEQALAIYREIGDRIGEGLALGNLGNAYLNLEDYRQAIELYEQRLAISREIEDRRSEGNAMGNLGLAYHSLEEYHRAIDFFEQTLAIFREIGDRHGEGNTLSNLGNTYDSLGDYRQAIAFHEQALAIARELDKPDRERIALEKLGDALGSLGNVYLTLEDYSQAITFFEQSLEIAREIGNHTGEGLAMRNLGRAYYRLRDYLQAITFFEQSLDIFRESSNRFGEGLALRHLGDVYLTLEDYSQAITFFEQYLEVAHEIGNPDPTAEGFTLVNLGTAYGNLGDYRQAITAFEQSLDNFREIGNRAAEGANLLNLGSTYFKLGDYRQAVTFFEQSLDIFRESGNHAAEGFTLVNLGAAYSVVGDHPQGLNAFEQSLDIFRETGNRLGEGQALNNLGNAYRNLQQYDRAIDFYSQALTTFSALGSRAEEGIVLRNIGNLLDQQDNPDLAIVFLKASVDVRESIRGDIRGLDTALQQSFTDTIAGSYRRLADLLLSQGRIPEAQQVLDLLQLEELREFTNTRATWTGTALAYTDIEQPVVTAHGDLIAFGQQVAACRQANCPQLTDLNRQLTALNRQYQDRVAIFQDQVRQNRRDDDVFQDPSRLGSDARALLAANPNSVLIYPFVTEDKLWLLWATSGAVGTVEVAVSQAELSQAVQQLGERLTRAGNLNDLQSASQRLYDWLVRPLEAPLEANNIEKLIFVNDRVTRYIPMAVLFDGERYLLERYTLSTVLSPAVTNTTSRLGAVDEAPVLGLGLTQAFPGFDSLPAVKDELTGIVRDAASPGQGTFPGSVFFDGDFTLETLETNLLGHRVLHIATHAAFVPGRPRDSYILLGNGSRLEVADIEAREHLLDDLHLVVLSACQTALGGSAGDGSEIAGISSYFLAPGRAETVIASLWKVNDNSTSVLMQRFYEFLATGELTKAEALRQAQLSLLYNEDTATRLAASRASISVETLDGRPLSAVGSQHPYHWAPFILIGNGL